MAHTPSTPADLPTELTNIIPSEVTFIREFRRHPRSRITVVFLVIIRNIKCVMKVFHSESSEFYELEATAYRRLTERGVYQTGFVPMFYGCIEHMDQRNWQPHLHRFLDEGPPNAILIEYIPGIEPLSIETATKERMAKFTEGLQAIHDAGIIHYDTYARNMMVDPSRLDKVVWLDFDRARTLDDTRLSDREKELIYDEQACMRAFQSLVAEDHEKKVINRSIRCW